MSCDNLADNGRIARDSFTSFARLLDPELGDWVAEHVRFPSSMVDRITPVTGEGDRAATTQTLGVEDAWPVVAEPYFAWALEDDFAAGRPPFEDAGVEVVADVGPWERMKLRLANGGHQALCHVGVLAGFEYAHEAAADPGHRGVPDGVPRRRGGAHAGGPARPGRVQGSAARPVAQPRHRGHAGPHPHRLQ